MSIAAVSSSNDVQQSNYLNNPVLAARQLAASQTISSASDVRLALGTAMASSHYASPLQQAWTDLSKSLTCGALAPGEMVYGAGTGDLSAAKTALDSYTQLLPSSPLYMSTLTTPSQTFSNDLKTLGKAIDSGDLAGAQTAFATAQRNAPEDIGSAMAQANFSGDADNQARLTMETAAYFSGYLTSIGYTPTNADIEANAMTLGGVTENTVLTTAQDRTQEAQAEQQTTAISRLESSSAPTSNQLAATAETAMYKIYDAIFAIDPLAVKNSNMSVFNERDAVLNKLEGSLMGQNSGDASSTSVSSVNVSV